MIYQRYFKAGQKLLLKAVEQSETEKRTDLLSATLQSGDDDLYILQLPYSEDATEQYPFAPEMPFEISSEALGLGIRVTGIFQRKIDGQRIAVKIQPNLQMFQRRASPRLDCRLGIRFTRGHGSLKALRETWNKNIKVLHGPNAPINLEGFNLCQVNISSGGIRFPMRPPVTIAELCLMLINLDDGKVPICTLAEIVWAHPERDENIFLSGMRFINILDEDQKRLERFIADRTGPARPGKPERSA